MRFALPFGLVVLLIPCPVGAWIYPEHRDILALALSDLRADQRQLFLELWADARRGRESRYCATVVDGDGRSEPACIDLAAWAGIAGDHSCSPELLLSKTLPSDWILKVAKVSAETKVKFEKATGREAKQNAAAINNLKLQFVDKEYTTRAGANNGHFLTARTSDDSKDYLVRTLGAEAEPNALGLSFTTTWAQSGWYASGRRRPTRRRARSSRGRSWLPRRSPSTSSRTPSPPAMSLGVGATSPSGKERTTTTRNSGSTHRPGTEPTSPCSAMGTCGPRTSSGPRAWWR